MLSVVTGGSAESSTGSGVAVPPVWLMRQAGRYLPEYRAVRAKTGGFLDLCFNPELATEVTLQPVQRFDLDAAIIFADILLVPYALGRDLRFVEGEGPRLDPLREVQKVGEFDHEKVRPVYTALHQVRQSLAATKALIGFCGAPWTVACYMVEGGGSKDFAVVQQFARERRGDFLALLDILVVASAEYLCAQIASGAQIVQIFDSWAGLVAESDFADFVLAPTQKIVAAVRREYPGFPVIGFPRGAGARYSGYREKTGVTVLGLDEHVGFDLAQALQRDGVVQGNLDPRILVQGEEKLRGGVAKILRHLGNGKLIFNLGHGITPDTPPEHVAELVRLVRGG